MGHFWFDSNSCFCQACFWGELGYPSLSLQSFYHLLGQMARPQQWLQVTAWAGRLGKSQLVSMVRHAVGPPHAHVVGFQQMEPSPPVLIIHLGCNDLGQRTTLSLRLQAHVGISRLHQLWPGINFLWSDLLPQHVWRWVQSIQKIDIARHRLNEYLVGLLQQEGKE